MFIPIYTVLPQAAMLCNFPCPHHQPPPLEHATMWGPNDKLLFGPQVSFSIFLLSSLTNIQICLLGSNFVIVTLWLPQHGRTMMMRNNHYCHHCHEPSLPMEWIQVYSDVEIPTPTPMPYANTSNVCCHKPSVLVGWMWWCGDVNINPTTNVCCHEPFPMPMMAMGPTPTMGPTPITPTMGPMPTIWGGQCQPWQQWSWHQWWGQHWTLTMTRPTPMKPTMPMPIMTGPTPMNCSEPEDFLQVHTVQ